MKIKTLVRQAIVWSALAWPLASHAQTPVWEGPLRSSLDLMADNLTKALKPWPVPDRVFDVTNYGAVGDGATLNTGAIQKAIDACSAAGGGVVLVQKGDYVTGTIDLKSGVMLEIAKDTKLLGSTQLGDYPDRVPSHPTVMDTWMKLRLSLIYAENCERVGIRGDGVIDGRGELKNFPGVATIKELPGRPFLIRMIECRKVTIDGIHLRDAASWMEDYLNCDDLIVQNLHVENVGNWNNDGIDIDGCHNVIVRDSEIYAEDDGMCFKGAGMRAMENVLVENCKVYSTCNALKFGTDSQGDFRNVLLRHMALGGPTAAMPALHHGRAISGISWGAVDGGTVENVMVEDATIDRADSPFCLRLGNRGRVPPDMPKPAPGQMRRLIFEKISGSDNGARGSLIGGIPGYRVQDAVFRSVTLSVGGGGTAKDAGAVIPEKIDAYPDAFSFASRLPAYGFWIRHADGLTFDGVTITATKPDARQAFVVGLDATAISVNGVPMADHPNGTKPGTP